MTGKGSGTQDTKRTLLATAWCRITCDTFLSQLICPKTSYFTLFAEYHMSVLVYYFVIGLAFESMYHQTKTLFSRKTHFATVT